MSVTRQHTRALVVIHSHVNNLQYPDSTGNGGRVIDVSDDLVSLVTSKTTTSAGKFQFTLVPRRNYHNLIFPNDVVNIYVDPGDGKRGFVRLMMGYVDRLEENSTVDEMGATKTNYVIMGSDFQKAIDRTSLYFNAYFRQILDERFARTSDGGIRGSQRNDADGSALRNAGVTGYGSPADFVENFLLTLLGFGSQWKLPDSYPRTSNIIAKNQDQRVQRALEKIPDDLRALVSKLGLDDDLYKGRIDNILKKLRQVASAEKTAKEKEFEYNDGKTVVKIDEATKAAATNFRNSPFLLGAGAAFARTGSDRISILDLLTFDFIESLTIDGFNSNQTVMQTQNATLGQLLYGNSNEFINELIFDLRPVTAGSAGQDGGMGDLADDKTVATLQYSRESDELGCNTKGFGSREAAVAAVKYVPAVVFREYPYSTVEKYDISNVMVVPASIDPTTKASPGEILFGPIFTVNKNQAGRHIYKYPEKISVVSSWYGSTAKPLKHIDAISITRADVTNYSVGRSDEETFNILQLTPQGITNVSDQFRSVLTNFSPVINQVSVARHGLRVWEGTTQFANYGSKGPNPGVGGSADNAQVRRNLVRWQLMMDHWYQHNIEYLSGEISLRAMPEIRVGYRLDWTDRSESYYVEGVVNEWAYPGAMTTTVHVTRGQRNDPFPVYVPPVFLNEFNEIVQASGDRSETGRLGRYFAIRDTPATTRAVGKQPPFSADDRNEVDYNLPLSSVVVREGASIGNIKFIGPIDPRKGKK